MLTHEQKATIEALDGLLIPVLQDMIVEYLGVLTFTFKPGDFRWFIWKSSNITFMPTWGVCSSRKFLGRSM